MPDPLIVQFTRSRQAALLQREQQTVGRMVAQWQQITVALDAEIDRLAVAVSSMENVTDSKLFRLQRYRSLLQQAQDQLDQYAAFAERTIDGERQAYAQQGVQDAVGAIRAAGVTGAFDTLPVAAVQEIVAASSPGGPIADLLKASYGDAYAGMTDALIRGVALGKNPRDTAVAMAKGLDRGLTRMLAISRTESLRAYKEASRSSYIQSGVVSGFRRIATHDRRSCVACLARDGERYDLNTPLASHVNCRCAMVPIVNGLRDIPWEYGPEWLRKQDAETHIAVMGRGRYDLWRRGKITIEDMPKLVRDPTWGDAVIPKTLAELRR